MNFKFFFPGLGIFIITFFNSSGQSTDLLQNAISYRTGFYNFYHSNPDSALYYAQKMADVPLKKEFLREMLHEDFYMVFHDKTKQRHKAQALKNNYPNFEEGYKEWINICYTTLIKMGSDSHPDLANAVQPLQYWVNVAFNKDDPQKLAQLVNEFMDTQLEPNHLYQNASGRYALFIYEAVAEKKELEDLAQKLLSSTIVRLSSLQNHESIYLSPQPILEERAWNRYILACANNLMAKRYLEKGDFTKAGFYFKKAFDYSPDITDRRFTNEFHSDAYFLSDGDHSYLQTDYLNHLEQYVGDKSRILSAYADLAFKDPLTYKEKLSQIFERFSQGEESFSDFWLNDINSRLEEAPPVDLQKIGDGDFSSLQSRGKWIFIDFWGTWCGPCREEHPLLQKFNDDFVLDPQNNLELFTIACHDTEEKVRSYMSKYNYSFPVAMSDKNIEKAFNVYAYPTKVLITPQGKYLTIPFGTDWVNFIKEYASIQTHGEENKRLTLKNP